MLIWLLFSLEGKKRESEIRSKISVIFQGPDLKYYPSPKHNILPVCCVLSWMTEVNHDVLTHILFT